MYELLKADAKITVSEVLVDNYEEYSASLAEACGLALRQPITRKQKVFMTDATFRASGYALMIEENDERILRSKRKTFAPVALGSRVFSPVQLKMSLCCKEFWQYTTPSSSIAIYYGKRQYQHLLYLQTTDQ